MREFSLNASGCPLAGERRGLVSQIGAYRSYGRGRALHL